MHATTITLPFFPLDRNVWANALTTGLNRIVDIAGKYNSLRKAADPVFEILPRPRTDVPDS